MRLLSSYRKLSRPSRRLLGLGIFACTFCAFWRIIVYPSLTRGLIDAVNAGNMPQVRRLLRFGANPNQSKNIVFWDFDNMGGPPTALDTAAYQGRTDMVRLFLDRGAAVNLRKADENTTLMWAMLRHAPSDTIPLLLARGADIHTHDAYGNTLLTTAVTCSLGRQVQLFCDCGIDINARVRDDCTALEKAVIGGEVEETRILLEHGADWKHCARKENCAWLNAASSGNTAILKLLIAHGADVNAPIHDTTPLIAAAIGSHVESTRMLLLRGANPNPKTSDKQTLLSSILQSSAHNCHSRICKRKWDTIVLLLRKAGAK